VDIEKTDMAVVFIDPQNDVLSEKGANWGAVGARYREQDCWEHGADLQDRESERV